MKARTHKTSRFLLFVLFFLSCLFACQTNDVKRGAMRRPDSPASQPTARKGDTGIFPSGDSAAARPSAEKSGDRPADPRARPPERRPIPDRVDRDPVASRDRTGGSTEKSGTAARVGPTESTAKRSNDSAPGITDGDLEIAQSIGAHLEFLASSMNPPRLIWPPKLSIGAAIGTIDPEADTRSLYSGTAGGIILEAELFTLRGTPARGAILGAALRMRESGEPALLETKVVLPAKGDDGAGDRGMTTVVADPGPFGLHDGLAGEIFAADCARRALGLPAKKDDPDSAILAGVRRLIAAAKEIGDGIEWTESNDIIGGTAGIGLFLLDIGKEYEFEPALTAARKAGHRLLAVAEEAEGGLRWKMRPADERYIPNFSHGTAGVGYFLASLYDVTKDKRFLTAAESSARHLLKIADKENGGCRLPHHLPGGEDVYYMSYCHGPVGTARLFWKLAQTTGDDGWMKWVKRCADSVIASGAPEVLSDGFWKNHGACCGTAGIMEFMAAYYLFSGQTAYLDHAEVCARVLRRSAVSAIPGAKFPVWPGAEYRARPDDVVAQTGWAQGSAGIGLAFLRLHLAKLGRGPKFKLPDSPF
jgi:hypothetical protein